MTKKDYIAIASIIARNMTFTDNIGERATVRMIAKDFVDMLQADNPRFNRERFLDACNLFPSKDGIK